MAILESAMSDIKSGDRKAAPKPIPTLSDSTYASIDGDRLQKRRKMTHDNTALASSPFVSRAYH